jgi:hypothetical protein
MECGCGARTNQDECQLGVNASHPSKSFRWNLVRRESPKSIIEKGSEQNEEKVELHVERKKKQTKVGTPPR